MPIDVPGSDTYLKYLMTDHTLLSGTAPRDCGTPPLGCSLAITSSSATNTTVRGDDDGTVSFSYTGLTSGFVGTINLNGLTMVSGITATTGSYTFSGLTAGEYVIQITDSNECYDNVTLYILDGDFRTGDFFVFSPTGLTAVENPIIVRVGTAINNPVPAASTTTLTINNDLPDGYYIEFNITSPYEYVQKFYAKGYPNKTNYFLASKLKDKAGLEVGTNSHIEIATSLADALSNDILIPKIYYINNDDNVVTLQAKETGSKFNLDDENVLTYNASNTLVTTGITINQTQVGIDYCDGQITDNYSIGCEIMVNTDTTNQYPDVGQESDYNKIAELILPFSQDNVHKFDISSILKSQVITPKPNLTLTGSTLLPSVMQPYYCKLSEYYPLIANTNTVKKRYKTNTSTQWTINSSLDRYSANTMDEYLGDYLTNIDANFVITSQRLSFVWYHTISNYLINTGDTGTTNVMFSVWNLADNTMVKGWQTGTTFTGLTGSQFNMHISGMTDGKTYEFSKYFYFSIYSSGYDNTVVANRKTDVKFLTNSPNPKQIQRNSNEFLYFILPKNYSSALNVKGDLYFYDGTSETGQTFFTIATGVTNAGGCMIMNISYDKLGLANYEVTGSTNRKIKRAEIAVYQNDGVNGDQQYTEEKVYRFEIDEQPRKFGIVFQNALGMYDSFDMVGIVEESVKRDYDEYTVALEFANNGSLPQGFKNTATYNTKITKKIVCNTGWIDQNHFDWLMEILKSNDIYSTTTTNQNYLNLTEFSYKKSSLDDLYEAEFTFMQTIYENALTV